MFKVRIADLVIEINNKYKDFEERCGQYITSEEDMTQFSIEVTEDEIKALIDNEDIEECGYCETMYILRKICDQILFYDGFFMHSAVIAKDGAAYVFSAPSGTGKTTHILRWKKVFGDAVKIVNGDKPLFRWVEGKLYVYGTPWRGKEGFGENVSYPVKAFSFIERAEDNSIKRIYDGEITNRLFQQIVIPKDEKLIDLLFHVLDLVIEKYPFYLLKCNMEDEAAMMAYQKMGE